MLNLFYMTLGSGSLSLTPTFIIEPVFFNRTSAFVKLHLINIDKYGNIQCERKYPLGY